MVEKELYSCKHVNNVEKSAQLHKDREKVQMQTPRDTEIQRAILTHAESEGIPLLFTFLQKGILHGRVDVFLTRWRRIDLHPHCPDVFPEAQAHHIQVVATIAEGAT